ncbi:lipopolysaccharide biosynthesis protein [Mangrovimonas aestuarii]|uniref:lipopolysaccharide biosynthesis protein n=1 Tax=Mangrovimonas aestuarii TaxID=3018443 RepID=UPI0023782466|nr:lipopolysaccharide biosynthesis protein [Mangrovimonas aestuarii]
MKTQNKNLKQKSKAGLIWDLSGTFVRQIATFVVSIILARILIPEDFGVVGLALAFITISSVFIDVGFTDGLIQKKEVDDITYSSIFYTNLVLSLLLGLSIFLLSPVLGRFFGSQEVVSILKYLAIIPPIGALGKVHAAMLTRGLRFKSLTLRDIFATLFGGVVGIVCALNGFGVFSLVWQQITAALIGAIMLWFGTGWIPKAQFSWKSVRGLLSFSSFVFFDQALRQVFLKIDTLFIGKVFSPVTLGFYSRAESLNSQITNYSSSSLRKVMFPILSSIQEDDEQFQRVYYKVFDFATFLSSTLLGVLFFLSDQIIVFLLGSKWIPSIVLFQILIFRTLFAPHGALMGKSLLSKGYSRVKFNLSLIQRLVLLLPMLVGLFFGIKIFASAVVFGSFLGFILYSWAVDKYLNLSFKRQILGFLYPMLPFFILILFKAFVFNGLNSIYYALIFIGFHFTFLLLTKHNGFLFGRQELTKLIKKRI